MPGSLKNPQSRPVEVLLVEDNPADSALMREIFKQSRFPIHLNITRDGEEGMAYLRREGRYSYAQRPDIILLDLNMPKKDGREVLREIKEDPSLRPIPVLILTSSQDDTDVRLAYEAHANFYIVKPMKMEHFSVLLKYIEDFWIKTLPAPDALRTPKKSKT